MALLSHTHHHVWWLKDQPSLTHSPRVPVANIRYDADFLDIAFKRYRRQHPAWPAVLFIKAAGLLVLMPAAILLFWTGEPMPALVALAFSILILSSGLLERWRLKWAIAKSPFKDDDLRITFSADGFHASSPKQDVKLTWPIFTRVAHFKDGFLLFQGPKLFNWIPFSALEPSGLEELENLLHTHIKKHKVIKPAPWE